MLELNIYNQKSNSTKKCMYWLDERLNIKQISLVSTSVINLIVESISEVLHRIIN